MQFQVLCSAVSLDLHFNDMKHLSVSDISLSSHFFFLSTRIITVTQWHLLESNKKFPKPNPTQDHLLRRMAYFQRIRKEKLLCCTFSFKETLKLVNDSTSMVAATRETANKNVFHVVEEKKIEWEWVSSAFSWVIKFGMQALLCR